MIYKEYEKGLIYNGDCLEVLKELPSESVDCIVTSPPYNKGAWSVNRNVNCPGFKTKTRHISYGDFDDFIPVEEYEKQQRELIRECLRLLKPTGSLFYNHIDILHFHQTYHPLWVYDFPVKEIIIWNRKNTPKVDKSYFCPINEWIFWIQKTKETRVKFDRKKCIFKTNIWDMSPDVKNKFPAPFPEELPMNCILGTTDEGDLVLDPYSGSGTTCYVANKLNRRFIGIERFKDYCDLSCKRIESLSTSSTKTDLFDNNNEKVKFGKAIQLELL